MKNNSKSILVLNSILIFVMLLYFVFNVLVMYNIIQIDEMMDKIIRIFAGLLCFICLLVSFSLFGKIEKTTKVEENKGITAIIEEELKVLETETPQGEIISEEASEPVVEEVQKEASEPVVEEVQEEVIEPVIEEQGESNAEEEITENVEEVLEVAEPEIQVKPIDFSKIKYEGKLMYAPNEVKERYSLIKNHLLSYTGVTSRISNNKETFRKSGVISQIRLVNDKLYVYLAVIPEPFIAEGYKVSDVSNTKQYEETPTLIKVTNDKTLKQFVDILDVMMTSKNINKKQRFKEINYSDYLHLNGETILNGLGFSSEYLVNTINSKIISKDLPDDLIYYASTINGNALSDEVYKTTIYLDNLSTHFNDGDIITKKELLSKKLIKENDYVVIKGRGTLDKKLIIHADDFDILATKMIYITNGTIVHIKH